MKKVMMTLTYGRACSRSTKRTSSFCARLIAAYAAVLCCAVTATLSVGCGENKDKEAEALLQQAGTAFQQGEYDRALRTIDSLRRTFPNAIAARKQALVLQQDVELKRSQEELAGIDTVLLRVKREYEAMKVTVEQHKAELKATPDELTLLTKTRVLRDSLQTRYEALGKKIQYIHQKQKENK